VNGANGTAPVVAAVEGGGHERAIGGGVGGAGAGAGVRHRVSEKSCRCDVGVDGGGEVVDSRDDPHKALASRLRALH
jgi:hypothetical protein